MTSVKIDLSSCIIIYYCIGIYFYKFIEYLYILIPIKPHLRNNISTIFFLNNDI